MELSINDILRTIPHRYPFLLVDRILELEPGKRVVGLKNVSFNEEFFQGHFPGNPVMPGVLIIEALAQTGAVGMMHSMPDSAGKLLYFAGIEGCKFRRPVVPGDQLRLEIEFLSIRSKMSKCRGVARVGDTVCAEAQILSAIVDRPR